jgi:hypothetical protein
LVGLLASKWASYLECWSEYVWVEELGEKLAYGWDEMLAKVKGVLTALAVVHELDVEKAMAWVRRSAVGMVEEKEAALGAWWAGKWASKLEHALDERLAVVLEHWLVMAWALE